jgi:hypothetical protein
MTEKEPLKITLEDLGIEATPTATKDLSGRVREEAAQLGSKFAGAVKDTAGKVTAKVSDTTAEAASRSAEAVRDKVSETIQAQSKATVDAVEERLRSVDWKGEAQKSAESSLRWLSRRLEAVAERLHSEANEEPKPPNG